MTGPRIMSRKTSFSQHERAVPVPFMPQMEINQEVVLDVYCTETEVGDTVIVVGSCEELGQWNPISGLQLSTSHETFPRWRGSVHLKSTDFEFKLMIVNVKKKSAEWETSENRRFQCPGCKEGQWQVSCRWNNSCCKVQAIEASGKSMRVKQDADAALARAAFMPTVRDTDSDTFAATSATSPQRRTGLAQMIPQTSGYPMQKQPHTMTTAFTGATPQRSTSFSPLLAEQWARRENACPSKSEQRFCFKMKNVEEKDAKNIQVELVLQEQKPAITLNMENYDVEEQQAAWFLAAPTTDWTPGFHFFCFRINGLLMLSADHMCLGHWNVMHLNGPLRRYLLARDCRGQLSHGEPILETRRSKQIVDMAMDSFVASGSTADTVGLQELARHSTIARPYSVSGNLLSSTDSEDKSAHNSFRPFCSAVYEGLFDRELILRMDGVVLPEPPMPPTRTEPLDEGKLRLWGGAHSIKKAHGKCEDAYFLDAHGMGVADGVGCFATYKDYGVDAAAYAADLMQHACLALQPGGRASETEMGVADRAALAVAEAESRAVAFGGSTIAVLCQNRSQIGVANLGDSGFLLLRRGRKGMRIVTRSREQQHAFNCPYQLTRLPEALLGRVSKKRLAKIDTASDCEYYTEEIAQGDLVLMFSDGFSDNMHDHELLDIVNKALSPANADMLGVLDRCTPPATIAKALALAALERSIDETATVPFTATAKRHKVECRGGKEDDITVAAAWVVPDQSGLTPDSVNVEKILKHMHAEAAREVSHEECRDEETKGTLARTLFESRTRARGTVQAGDSKVELCGHRGPSLRPLSSSKVV
ncbi:unnamed protein product [Symbiodinium sp. CCMP2592]|nr:unnamed protein product [Symbiodinium sp. CCMP2592]